MTPEERYEGNKILGRFEGRKPDIIEHYHKLFKYSTSRDALWPVWERFRDMRPWDEGTHWGTEYQHSLRKHRIAASLAYESPEKVFSLLVEAVTWLNSTKGEKV